MPLTDARGQNIPYSTMQDKPNAQTLGQGIVNGVVDKLVMPYNSATVRGASIPVPTAGMVTYLKDVKLLQVYDGAAWVTVLSSPVTPLTWVNVTMPSAYVAYSSNTVAPRVRREGSIVYLEGRLKRSDDKNIPIADPITVGTVPTAYRPIGHYAEGIVSITNAGTGAPTGRIEIKNDTGEILLSTDKATPWVGFSSWWFVN
ncbi:hypothetical protein [Streptomyces sp. NBC_01180]|uniref:hypothetical protein n=1 Tax=Streptomyces sp. NBC_01180 TaxID=2903763 RepID=UPI00386D2EDF|nr:hypothetical protein OG708_09045 [Streptomyces sp. NBC_01180]